MYHISVQENNKSFSAFSINNPVTNANIWLIRNAIQIPFIPYIGFKIAAISGKNILIRDWYVFPSTKLHLFFIFTNLN